MYRLPRQVRLRHKLTTHHVQCVQQAHRKSRAGSHARSGWNITVVMDFQTALYSKLLECPAHGRVLDFLYRLHRLDLRINNAMFVLEKWRQGAR